ncbi:ABSCISIC ACID-INSENSITIVE 5-like protein 3 [Aegilops tauschii subsp. strangulata]|uniref:ABSCISIC ACID-INSENSITIVE 5-like protein 3 n=1 Tax=Aegilops tauschii subsp. strangulata TaxID=200361 RepID=UPI001ABD1B9A|nr:ABSCISIC ACID-INSENSITIVE 5-like protein 3 [Aegilops tauschii subsp. strangulata]
MYGLTLNEVESHLGEPLRSMNLEDLLRTVLPAAARRRDGKEDGGRGVARHRERRPVGEMTLEDFLSRAGVPVAGGCAGAHWLHQYHPSGAAPVRIGPSGVGAGPVLDAVYEGGAGVLLLL